MPSEESGMNMESTSIVSQAAPVAPSLSTRPFTTPPPTTSANASERAGLSQSHSLIDSRTGTLVITDGQFNQTHGHYTSLVINVNQGGSADSQSSSPPPSNVIRHISPAQISGTRIEVDNERQNQSQVSLQSQEISSQRSNDIYERHLTLKGRGFPLWIPGPNRLLHLNYRRTGVRIGDVGIITYSGAFSFLFNICLPHNDPVNLNSRGLPEHFAPICPPIDASDTEDFTVFENGSHLASASVKRSQTGTAISDIVFESSASEGAILTMPRGARSKDLGNLATFREYAAANVANWYRYINGPRGREAKNGEVRLVVGFDKTVSWGIATFANQTQQNSCCLKFGPSERDSASTYKWSENSGVADVRAGPSSNESDELRIDSDPPDVQFENQCLFVRTLNVTLADDVWADIHSSSGSIPVDPQYPRVRNYSDSNRPHSNNPGNGSNFSPSQGAQSQAGSQRRLQGVDRPPIFVSGPVESFTAHPSKVLNDTLLAKIPTAKMVITHDDDWSSVTQYDTLLDPHEFVANILASRDICQENDVVFLQPKNIINEISEGPASVNRAQVPEAAVVQGSPAYYLSPLIHDHPIQESFHSDLGEEYMVEYTAGITFDPAAPFKSPLLPHTSSYNGSYYSPYSQHSELSCDDVQLQDFPGPMNEYDPLDYDAPNQPASLLMFIDDSDYMSPHLSPYTRSTRSPFGHSSPSSNASEADEDDNSHLDDYRRSRASSVASNHPSPALTSLPQPSFDPSPRLLVNFGNTSVHTPNWSTVLPQLSPNLNAQSPLPAHKSQSPRLFMPDDQQQQQQQNVPIINVPHDDDDMMDSSQFCIVPATPISGGGAGRASVPFQTTLSTLNQGPELAPSNDHQQRSQQRQRDSSPSRIPRTEENNAVASTTNLSFSIFPNDRQQQRQQRRQQQQQQQQLESRLGYDFQRQQLQTFTLGGTPGESSTSRSGFLSSDSLKRSVSDAPMHHRQSRSEDIRSPMPYAGNNNIQPHSVGGTTTSNPPNVDFLTGQQQQYLHPSQATPSASHQQPHSLSLLSVADSVSNPDLSLSSSDNHRFLSPGMGHFRRASLGTRSDRGAERWSSLGTQGTLTPPRRMSPYPSPNASPRVRYMDQELDFDPTLRNSDNNSGLNRSGTKGLGMGMGGLGEPSTSAGFSEEVALSRRGGYAGLLDVTISGASGSQKADSVVFGGERSQTRHNVPSSSKTDVYPEVPKVNVTTVRTANASHRRRTGKQNANFVCTVPGCGATFTRGFNLKGHLRSHFEEKPYKCHWPGCGKGFTRQHDCKRHEQLHSNFRPFECEGCRKQFARMDALNRHLRSETGVECAKIVERGKGPGGVMGNMENGYDMSGITMSMTGGMVDLGMEQEEQKRLMPKRRQTGGGSGGADIWSGVTL